jgi:outer membrane protein
MLSCSRAGGIIAVVTVLIPICIGGVLQASAGTPLQLTLTEAVRLALEESPDAQLARADHDLARARLRQSRSSWLPHVRLSESYGRGNNPLFVFGSLMEQGVIGPEHFAPSYLNDPPEIENFRTSLTIEIPLFDQLRRVTTTGQARLGAERAAYEHEAARQQLRLETIRLYAGVLLAAKVAEVAGESVASAAADVEAIRQRVESGLLVESDLLAASVQLAELRAQEIRAIGDQAIAEAALRAVINLPPASKIELASELRLPPDQTTVTEILSDTARRPELEAARIDAAAARLEVRKERGSYLPRLDAFAIAGGSGASLRDYHGDRLYGVTLSFDILRPGRDGSVAASLAQQRAAEAQQRRVENESSVEIVSAWQDLEVARQRLQVSTEALGQARETMRIVRDRYEAGLLTVTEQLRAQAALSRAAVAVHSAHHETITAHARLLRATGRLENVDDFTQ